MKKLVFSLVSIFFVVTLLTQAQDNQMALTAKNDGAQGFNYYLRDANLIYSQMNPSSTAILSQTFPDFGNCPFEIADDFRVSGVAWNIDRVDVLGLYIGSGIASFFDVFFYANLPGQPGAPVYSGLGLPYTRDGFLFSITLNAPAILPPGNYWVAVRPNMPSANGNWYWFENLAPSIRDVFFVRDPCGLFIPFPNWAPGPVAIPNLNNYDLCFAFYDQRRVPLSDWAIYIGIGLILAIAVVRFRKLV